MTDHEIELQLRRSLHAEAADFILTIDHSAVRNRLSAQPDRWRAPRPAVWLAGAAAVVLLAAGLILAGIPRNGTQPGQASPSPSGLGPAASVQPLSPPPIQVDPGWRLALDRSATLLPGVNPIGLTFFLPADATRWALKVSCRGSSDLVVWSATFVHTVPCAADHGETSRAVYRVENGQASGQIWLGLRTSDAATFELIAETTATQLDDPLTVDPTPGPSDLGYPGPRVPDLVVPPGWSFDYARVNGRSNDTAGFGNDPGVPLFRPGPVTIVLVCIGSGSLDIELTTQTGGDPMPPFEPERGQTVGCSAADGQITVQLNRPATGKEDAVEVASSTNDPDVPFEWSVGLGQNKP